MTNIINNTNFPTNGNCKRVRDITTGKKYGSITEAAIVIGVSSQAVSNSVKKNGWCKGHKLILEKDLHDSIDVLCEENAKANRRATKEMERADKAEAKIAEMESEMTEFRKWKAEQEAKRLAEERRLEAERLAKEKWLEKKAKAEAKLARRTEICEHLAAKLANAEKRKMQAEIELEALLDREEVL